MADAKKIVMVRKPGGKITHVKYADGKWEAILSAIKRAQKGGVEGFDGIAPKTGSPYLRKTGATGLDKIPVEAPAKKPAAKKPAARKPAAKASRAAAKPAAKASAPAKKPAAKKPAAKKPAAKPAKKPAGKKK